MSWEFNNKTPIFKQIVDALTLKIIKGDYKLGEKLDSVRELAVDAGVNPNTMQRALVCIEETGLLETKRGDGRYITEDKEIILKLKREYILENIKGFLELMGSFQFSKEEIIDMIEKNDINGGNLNGKNT